MMNRRELEKMLQHLKAEYMEALERGNEKIQNNIVNVYNSLFIYEDNIII